MTFPNVTSDLFILAPSLRRLALPFMSALSLEKTENKIKIFLHYHDTNHCGNIFTNVETYVTQLHKKQNNLVYKTGNEYLRSLNEQ